MTDIRAARQGINTASKEFRRCATLAMESAERYLAGLAHLPVFPDITAAEVRNPLATDLALEGCGLEQLIQDFEEHILPASRHNGHPRMFGYITSPGTAA